MGSKQRNRRGFLKDGAALAGLAVGAIPSASGQAPASQQDVPYGVRSRFENSARLNRGGVFTPQGARRHRRQEFAEDPNAES